MSQCVKFFIGYCVCVIAFFAILIFSAGEDPNDR